jgi:hypothetical protein
MFDFNPGTGLGRAFERTEIMDPPAVTAEEWAEFQRLHQQRHELRRPVGLEVCIDGHTYVAQTDHRGGPVIELPAERANQLLNRSIDLGGGNWLRITFQTINN